MRRLADTRQNPTPNLCDRLTRALMTKGLNPADFRKMNLSVSQNPCAILCSALNSAFPATEHNIQTPEPKNGRYVDSEFF